MPAVLLIVLNWFGFVGFVVERIRTRTRRGFSFAPPFLSGLVAAVACLICPVDWVNRFAWCPLVLDPSILLLGVATGYHPVARAFGLRSMFDSPPSS